MNKRSFTEAMCKQSYTEAVNERSFTEAVCEQLYTEAGSEQSFTEAVCKQSHADAVDEHSLAEMQAFDERIEKVLAKASSILESHKSNHG